MGIENIAKQCRIYILSNFIASTRSISQMCAFFSWILTRKDCIHGFKGKKGEFVVVCSHPVLH